MFNSLTTWEKDMSENYFLWPDVSDLPMLLKFLTAEGTAPTGWGRYTKGRWRSVRGGLMPCANGLHATTADNLVPFLDAQLWRCEAGDEYVWHEDANGRKLVARRLRIVERFEAWNDRTARLFAADCAERVLPLFEEACPGDDRPRRAIETARLFADGAATAAARDAAWEAAWAAAGDAAGAAARDAAWEAERRWQNEHLRDVLGLGAARE
jgi:hypothetical protein